MSIAEQHLGTAGFSKPVLPEVIICGPWGGGGERLGGDDPEGQDAGEADQEGAQDGPHPLDHLHLVPRLQGGLWGREGTAGALGSILTLWQRLCGGKVDD